MLHIRGRCSLSFLCPEDFHSPANGDMQVAPIYQGTLPITYTTRMVPGLLLALSHQRSGLAQGLSVSVLCLAWQAPVCPPCVPHLPVTAETSSMMWRPAPTFPSLAAPMFSLYQSSVSVVAASLEECGRSQHSCMKTELTLCYISSLLTWNSTVSFLADK